MAIDLRDIASEQSASNKNERSGSGIGDVLNRDIKLFSSGLSDKKKQRFYGGLAILFSSGVDVRTVLDLIEEEQNSKADREIFGGIREHILKGGTFSSALEATGKFSTYEYFSIKIGEESGRLAQVLQDLSDYYSGRIAQRRKMMSALSYPVLVLFTALGAIWFMLRVVVPMFEDVFARFGGDLPALTKLVIRASEALAASANYLLIVIASVLLIVVTQRKAQWYRKLSSGIMMRMPIFGPLLHNIYLARFCHSMNLLIGANTPLVEAIGLVERMITFYPMEAALGPIQDRITHGASLHEALAEHRVFPKRLVSLIKVAEEVNQLDRVFDQLADQYGQEVEHRSGMLNSVLEPFLIIFIGLLVAVILIAMYLPLFNLSTNIG